MRGNTEHIVVIDEDSDSSDCVVIDVTESCGSESHGRGAAEYEGRFSSCEVISIDDEEQDDNEECNSGRTFAGGREHFPNSRRYESHMPWVKVKSSEFNISRCTKVDVAGGLSRNRYEVDSDPDSDSSDCEIIEDPSVEIRQLWPNSFRRKSSYQDHDGSADHSSSDSSVASCSKRAKTQDCHFAESDFANGSKPGDEPHDHQMENSFFESDSRCEEKMSCSLGTLFKEGEKDVMFDREILHDTLQAEYHGHIGKSDDCCFPVNTPTGFADKEKDYASINVNRSESSENCNNFRDGIWDDLESDSNRSSTISRSDGNLSEDNVQDIESAEISGSFDVVGEEDVGVKACEESDSDQNVEKHDRSKEKDVVMDIPTPTSVQVENPSTSTSFGAEVCNKMSGLTFLVDENHAGSGNMINQREQMKETDEYKRAMEQEWISRQKQLQIQAEEAQRLRKRKKASLEMQVRQRQRLEEIRQTQKKDEEHLHLKDQLRAEIRKELDSLEIVCMDMPSLLRGLGIPLVADPLPTEVHAAYKRAILKFHPDRVAKSDIRRQVEAEEKFKLICRMKTLLSS